MKSMMLAAIMAIAAPAAGAAQSLLYFDSQLGDDIGVGREVTAAPPDATLVARRNERNGVSVEVTESSAGRPIAWTLDLAAAGNPVLVPGVYEAVRYDPGGGTGAGLLFAGDGRSCSSLTGRFRVLEAEYDAASGAVVRFAVDFEQHCDGMFPALLGELRYHSPVPASRVVPDVTPVLAAHLAAARSRVDGLRAAQQVGPATWTDAALVPGATRIRAVHLSELRARVNDLYTRAGRMPPFTTATVAAGTLVRARDMNEILDAIGVLERPTAIARLGPSVVAVEGRRLMVQRRLPGGRLAPAAPFVVRGVTWSPASRTTMTTPADPDNAHRRRPEFGIWFRTDIPLMRAMGVNTVRLFIDPGFDATLGPIGRTVLDELYRSGIMVIMTVDDGINDLARVQGAVTYYRDHPAILMWSLGSEWNINRYFRGAAWSPLFAAQRTEIAAQLVKSLDGHPVVSSYGEIDVAAAGLRLADTTGYVRTVVPSADVWSLNLYRGNTFDNAANESVFDQWTAITAKPMFIGEFGIDAFHGRCLSNPPSGAVNEDEQIVWNRDLWDDIARRLSAADPAQPALGGTVFEWNDEWWKAGSASTQDTGGWTSDGFPDWHASEDYFGIVDIDRRPRAVYATLTEAFAPGYVAPPHRITLRAISRGANLCGAQADFRRDGHTFYQRFGGAGGGRGFNVAIVDAATGAIVDAGRNFDTWGGGDPAKQALVDHLGAIPPGRLVLLAVADEAGINAGTGCSPRTDAMTMALVQRLQALGSTRIDEYCWRGSWAMAAIAGSGTALAEDYSRTEEARAEPALTIPE